MAAVVVVVVIVVMIVVGYYCHLRSHYFLHTLYLTNPSPTLSPPQLLHTITIVMKVAQPLWLTCHHLSLVYFLHTLNLTNQSPTLTQPIILSHHLNCYRYYDYHPRYVGDPTLL